MSVLAGSRGKHFADAEIVHKDQRRILALLITPGEGKCISKEIFHSSPMSPSNTSVKNFFFQLFVEKISWIAFVLNNLHSFPLPLKNLLILQFGIVLSYFLTHLQ